MNRETSLSLTERLRHYADREATHAGLVLAHRDDLCDAACEIEFVNERRSAPLQRGEQLRNDVLKALDRLEREACQDVTRPIQRVLVHSAAVTATSLHQRVERHRRVGRADVKLVIVTWDDAQASGGWKLPNEIDHRPDRITSVGWLVRRDDIGITICQSHNIDDRLADTLFVPAAYVRKVKTVAA